MYYENNLDSLVNLQIVKEEHKLLLEKMNNQRRIRVNN